MLAGSGPRLDAASSSYSITPANSNEVNNQVEHIYQQVHTLNERAVQSNLVQAATARDVVSGTQDHLTATLLPWQNESQLVWQQYQQHEALPQVHQSQIQHLSSLQREVIWQHEQQQFHQQQQQIQQQQQQHYQYQQHQHLQRQQFLIQHHLYQQQQQTLLQRQNFDFFAQQAASTATTSAAIAAATVAANQGSSDLPIVVHQTPSPLPLLEEARATIAPSLSAQIREICDSVPTRPAAPSSVAPAPDRPMQQGGTSSHTVRGIISSNMRATRNTAPDQQASASAGGKRTSAGNAQVSARTAAASNDSLLAPASTFTSLRAPFFAAQAQQFSLPVQASTSSNAQRLPATSTLHSAPLLDRTATDIEQQVSSSSAMSSTVSASTDVPAGSTGPNLSARGITSQAQASTSVRSAAGEHLSQREHAPTSQLIGAAAQRASTEEDVVSISRLLPPGYRSYARFVPQVVNHTLRMTAMKNASARPSPVMCSTSEESLDRLKVRNDDFDIDKANKLVSLKLSNLGAVLIASDFMDRHGTMMQKALATLREKVDLVEGEVRKEDRQQKGQQSETVAQLQEALAALQAKVITNDPSLRNLLAEFDTRASLRAEAVGKDLAQKLLDLSAVVDTAIATSESEGVATRNDVDARLSAREQAMTERIESLEAQVASLVANNAARSSRQEAAQQTMPDSDEERRDGREHRRVEGIVRNEGDESRVLNSRLGSSRRSQSSSVEGQERFLLPSLSSTNHAQRKSGNGRASSSHSDERRTPVMRSRHGLESDDNASSHDSDLRSSVPKTRQALTPWQMAMRKSAAIKERVERKKRKRAEARNSTPISSATKTKRSRLVVLDSEEDEDEEEVDELVDSQRPSRSRSSSSSSSVICTATRRSVGNAKRLSLVEHERD